jgi:hypothetical protein
MSHRKANISGEYDSTSLRFETLGGLRAHLQTAFQPKPGKKILQLRPEAVEALFGGERMSARQEERRGSERKLTHEEFRKDGAEGETRPTAWECWDAIENSVIRITTVLDILTSVDEAERRELEENKMAQIRGLIWDQTEIIREAAEQLFRLTTKDGHAQAEKEPQSA